MESAPEHHSCVISPLLEQKEDKASVRLSCLRERNREGSWSGRVSDSRSGLWERYRHVWANNFNCPTGCTVLSVSILHSCESSCFTPSSAQWLLANSAGDFCCHFSRVLVPDGVPPARISSRHQIGKFRGSAVISVGFTAYSCLLEFFISTPLASTRV